MKDYVEKLWELKYKKESFEWSIDVIMGSSLCCKSLHPKIKLCVGEHNIEMNTAKFATLRFVSSKLLLNAFYF